MVHNFFPVMELTNLATHKNVMSVDLCLFNVYLLAHKTDVKKYGSWAFPLWLGMEKCSYGQECTLGLKT